MRFAGSLGRWFLVLLAAPAAGAWGQARPEEGLQPYTPPTLAELDRTAQWTDGPVKDSLELLRQKQAQEKPLVSLAEALRLRNTSPQNNLKILSALGRLPDQEGQVNWEASVNRYLRGDIKSPNPLLASSIEEFDVLTVCGISLIGFNWRLEPYAERDVVRAWQVSKDHLVDKFVLRDDLTWSDGRPVTAHDVVFSFRAIMNPKVPAVTERTQARKIRWVHAYDDHTLAFFHKEPLATNVWNVAFNLIPKHVYEKTIPVDPTLQQSPEHVQLEYQPITSGPYRIAKRVRNQEIVCERREEWYRQRGKQVRDKPFFKTIRFRIKTDANTALLALKSGELDDLELNADQWQSQTVGDDFYKLNTKASGLEWTYFYFGWNNKSRFFKDRRVREAMSYAFDYDEMINKLFHGVYERCNGVFHREAWMAPKKPSTPYKHDPDRAEDLLRQAGWEDHDGDGTVDKELGGRSVPLEFNLLVRQDPERLAVCTLLKQNLDEIGVVCNIVPLEATVLQQRVLKHEFDASFGGWGTGADPDTSENVWATGEGRNFLQYSNPEVDRLFRAGRKEFDRAKRGEIYGRIHELIFADQPCTFLYFQNSFYGFNKQLRGYMFSPRGPYHYGPGFGSFWKSAD